jgi:hypothetical protein
LSSIPRTWDFCCKNLLTSSALDPCLFSCN